MRGGWVRLVAIGLDHRRKGAGRQAVGPRGEMEVKWVDPIRPTKKMGIRN